MLLVFNKKRKEKKNATLPIVNVATSAKSDSLFKQGLERQPGGLERERGVCLCARVAEGGTA